MKSERIKATDARRAWRLLSDARDLRGRAQEQSTVLIDGLCRLFGADNGFFLHMGDYRVGGRLSPITFQYGTVQDAYLDRWMQGRLGTEKTLHDDIMVVHSIERTQRTTVLTHGTIWPTLNPRHYPVYADVLPAYQLHDNLVLLFRPGRTADMAAFALHRRDLRKDYTPGQRELAKLLSGEFRRMHDRGLLTVPPPTTRHLPRRTAEVLKHLLAGQSPKQIAPKLGLSIHTVRDHVKYLLEHYAVSSTPELLAKLLRPDGG